MLDKCIGDLPPSDMDSTNHNSPKFTECVSRELASSQRGQPWDFRLVSLGRGFPNGCIDPNEETITPFLHRLNQFTKRFPGR